MKKDVKKIIAAALFVAMFLSLGVVSVFGASAAVEKTDRFSVMETGAGNYMTSSDGELVIIISDGVPVYFEDDIDVRGALVENQTLMGVLDGRKMTVTYAITTMSLPPQTTPTKVIVHYETAVHPIGTLTPDDLAAMTLALNGEILVNNELLKAPAPFLKPSDDAEGLTRIMVPLRAVAEAMGFDVNWDGVTQSVKLGVAISVFIGSDEYHVGRMAPISLGAAAELKDGFTYVPLTFFKDVVAGYDVYLFEGQIVVIDSDLNDMN